MPRVAVIGAGATGLAAAYDLTRSGLDVTVYEAGAEVGGLAAGFRDDAWDWNLEKFYHHWFANDHAVLNLIKELGAWDDVIFRRPISSTWHNGQIYPVDRPNMPVAVLRLPMSWPSKLRFGLVGVYLKFFKNWKPMERFTAEVWLRRYMGNETYEALWRPALIAKFGQDYDKVNMAWLWARIYKRTPRLGTFQGGFQAFLELLAAQVRKQGGEICLNTPVERVRQTTTGKLVLTVSGKDKEFDAVISTSSPQITLRLAPELPPEYTAKLSSLKSLGAVVVILALRHQLMADGTYWLALPANNPNKTDGEFPFLALIEHTNYMDRSHYGGDHLVYCGDYVAPDHEYFSLSEDALTERFTGVLKRFNPNFSPEWIRKRWVFRTRYAQPVPYVNHSQALPDLRTPLAGLYMASMSQVYPWDRGTNYSVKMGREVAAMVMEDLARRA